MKYQKTITLRDGRQCVLRNGTAEDARTALDSFNLTHAETDYLLTYHGNAGSQTREVEATVTVTGTGAYTGSCTATFKILPPDPKGATSGQTSSKSAIDIATAIVDPLEVQRYTGKPLTPKPQVNVANPE